MKRIYSIILFIVCVLIGYFVSKEFIPNKTNNGDDLPVDTTGITNDTITIDSTTIKDEETNTTPSLSKEETDPSTNTITNPTPTPSIKPKEPTPSPPAHVNISLQEIKSLIQTGKYARDTRIAKNYKIQYTDVSDDDTDNLQQNFTYIQQRVEYETWRDFEVVSIDYDEQGKVNNVTIRPIY